MSTQRTRSAIYRSGRLPRMAKLKGMEKNHRMAMAERSRKRQQTTKLQQPSPQDVLSVKFLHLLCAGLTAQRPRGNQEVLAEESQPDDKREQEEHQPEELQHEAEGQGHQEDDDNPGESSDEEESSDEDEKNNDWERPSCKRSRRESMGEFSPVNLASVDQDDKPKKKKKQKTQAPSVCSSPGASPESGDYSQEQPDSFHHIYFPQPQELLHPEEPVVGVKQPPSVGSSTTEVLPYSMDDALSCFPLSVPWDFDEQSYFYRHDAQNYSAYHGNSHNDADFLVVEGPVRSHQEYLQPLLMLYQQQEGGEAATELTSFEEFNTDAFILA